MSYALSSNLELSVGPHGLLSVTLRAAGTISLAPMTVRVARFCTPASVHTLRTE